MSKDGTGGRVDAEQVKSLLLEFGRAGVGHELVSWIERGGDCVSCECGEVAGSV